MRVVRMPGDGNCLFHSLAYPRGHHRMVRACIVRHIARNWESEFRPFVVAEERGGYVREMIRPGTWGDELVLRAFSDLARRRVRVYTPQHWTVVAEYGRDFETTVDVLFSGCHYDVLVP